MCSKRVFFFNFSLRIIANEKRALNSISSEVYACVTSISFRLKKLRYPAEIRQRSTDDILTRLKRASIPTLNCLLSIAFFFSPVRSGHQKCRKTGKDNVITQPTNVFRPSFIATELKNVKNAFDLLDSERSEECMNWIYNDLFSKGNTFSSGEIPPSHTQYIIPRKIGNCTRTVLNFNTFLKFCAIFVSGSKIEKVRISQRAWNTSLKNRENWHAYKFNQFSACSCRV